MAGVECSRRDGDDDSNDDSEDDSEDARRAAKKQRAAEYRK